MKDVWWTLPNVATPVPSLLLKTFVFLVTGWYVVWSSSSYLLLLVSVILILAASNALLSRNSLSTSLWIDDVLQSFTYPQEKLRNFFLVQDFTPFPSSINYSVISRPIYVLLDNVIDKFVLSWHTDITTSKSFPRLVRLELVQVIEQVYYRCSFVNKYDLIQHIMDIWLVRLQEVSTASVHNFTQIQHIAASSVRAQDQYVRAICDLLMRICVSKVNYDCEALRAVLREILSTQLLTRVVDLVSEPSFLYRAILLLLEDDDDEEFSSLSDDDKEFLRSKPRDKRPFEIITDVNEVDEDSTTIQFGTLDHEGHRSNKFRIPKVRLFGEGLSRFAVYVIEYSDTLWKSSLGSDDEISIHLVGRRFKEFAALHERLMRDKATKLLLKDVTFPSKEPLSSFPFNRLDREFLTGRRDLFAQYLNDICQHDVVLHSDDVKEFLGFDKREITVFKRKSTSFIESKIGQNISKMFRSFTRSISLSDSRREDDDSMLEMLDSEMYASYRESVRHTKKLNSLSREHAAFLKAPPSTDINDTLDKFIRRQMELGSVGPIVPTPEKYYNPENVCVSIRDSRYCVTLFNIIQQIFSSSGCILGAPGLAMALSTALRLPINRYFINKINLLTSENYWFVYLTKLNQSIFEEDDEEEEEVSELEFENRIKARIGKDVLLRLTGGSSAIHVFARSLGDKDSNKAMLFMIVDHFLSMFVPELEDDLKPLYRN